MTTYKYLTEATLSKIDADDISRMSCSVENPEYQAWLAEGNTPEPADPVPNPRIQEIYAELALIDTKSIRSIREGDTVHMLLWEAQATALRSELNALA